MADQNPIPLGPWPLGVDNVHDARHQVFQVPGKGQPPARLNLASNVDLNDEGWPRSRPQAALTAVTNGQGIEEVGGRVFYQANGSLYEHCNSTALITGLSARAALGEFGGRILVSDGSHHYEIDGSTVRTWGLPIPTVALASAAGSTFAAGTYLVQCSFTDGRNEGGCSRVVVITLATAANIQVSVSGLDSRVTGINLYIGTEKQPATSYAKTVTTSGTGTQTFAASVPTTVNDPPRTEDMHGPVTGLTGMFPFRAFNMVYRDGALWRSQAAEPHLYHAKTIYQVPGTIRGGGGLPSGFWLGTDKGLWWMFGEEPPFVGVQKTFEPVLKGAKVIDGWKLSFLQVSDPVVLFVAPTGLVAGLPSGEVLPITRDRYHVDFATYSEARFAYVERDIRQLLVSLSLWHRSANKPT